MNKTKRRNIFKKLENAYQFIREEQSLGHAEKVNLREAMSEIEVAQSKLGFDTDEMNKMTEEVNDELYPISKNSSNKPQNRLFQLSKHRPMVSVYRSGGDKICSLCKDQIPDGSLYIVLSEDRPDPIPIHLKHFSKEVKNKVEKKLSDYIPKRVAHVL